MTSAIWTLIASALPTFLYFNVYVRVAPGNCASPGETYFSKVRLGVGAEQVVIVISSTTSASPQGIISVPEHWATTLFVDVAPISASGISTAKKMSKKLSAGMVTLPICVVSVA